MENLQQQYEQASERHLELFNRVQHFESEWLVGVRCANNPEYSEEHRQLIRRRMEMDIATADRYRKEMREASMEVTRLKFELMSQNA